MKLIVVSGRSGSGKTTALHVLEDTGFYCIDNLPIGLLPGLTREVTDPSRPTGTRQIAASIDARNLSREFHEFPQILQALEQDGHLTETIYLDADDQTLIKRFHGTRRKHPLSGPGVSLKEAIQKEKKLLEPIAANSSLFIDTSHLTIYQLRDQVKLRILGHQNQELALLVQSFGFKHGVPTDSDYVFDVRCLPNPHWDPGLRMYRGTDEPVIRFLESRPEVNDMLVSIERFLREWLPQIQNSNRTYLTVSIGCTGGQHRSVYIAEALYRRLAADYPSTQIRHQELSH